MKSGGTASDTWYSIGHYGSKVQLDKIPLAATYLNDKGKIRPKISACNADNTLATITTALNHISAGTRPKENNKIDEYIYESLLAKETFCFYVQAGLIATEAYLDGMDEIAWRDFATKRAEYMIDGDEPLPEKADDVKSKCYLHVYENDAQYYGKFYKLVSAFCILLRERDSDVAIMYQLNSTLSSSTTMTLEEANNEIAGITGRAKNSTKKQVFVSNNLGALLCSIAQHAEDNKITTGNAIPTDVLVPVFSVMLSGDDVSMTLHTYPRGKLLDTKDGHSLPVRMSQIMTTYKPAAVKRLNDYLVEVVRAHKKDTNIVTSATDIVNRAMGILFFNYVARPDSENEDKTVRAYLKTKNQGDIDYTYNTGTIGVCMLAFCTKYGLPNDLTNDFIHKTVVWGIDLTRIDYRTKESGNDTRRPKH